MSSFSANIMRASSCCACQSSVSQWENGTALSKKADNDVIAINDCRQYLQVKF